MIGSQDGDRAVRTLRSLRLIAIMHAGERAGLRSLAASIIHALAYLLDALAPVWSVRILDALILKQKEGPWSPMIQQDIDRLVGSGVLLPENISHVRGSDDSWRLQADYRLNSSFASRVIESAMQFDPYVDLLNYVEETVFAISAFKSDAIDEAAAADEAYSDPMVDFGSLINLHSSEPRLNRSIALTRRFRSLMSEQTSLSDAELIHTYVRYLRAKLARVA